MSYKFECFILYIVGRKITCLQAENFGAFR